MKTLVPRKILAGFLLTAIISSGAGVLLYRVGMQFRENRQNVARTGQVLTSLQGLLTMVDDASTSARVYVLTGDPTYLDPFDRTLSAYPATLQELRTLTADNPSQQTRLSELEPHLRTGMGILKHLVELRRDQGMEAVLLEVTPDVNRREMETIRSTILAMRGE